MLPLTFQSRPLTVQAIVMTNGNTGVSDVIIGNHHCRLLWDALQSNEEMIIRKPPDGGEPMRIPIDWRVHCCSVLTATLLVCLLKLH